mmetsp:Transcript_30600/g.68634  ORF Transcript_30600/g.68634 Transcript_30600/m.68634 type:complete len:219 (-) Transcript_30600:65-721(-)
MFIALGRGRRRRSFGWWEGFEEEALKLVEGLRADNHHQHVLRKVVLFPESPHGARQHLARRLASRLAGPSSQDAFVCSGLSAEEAIEAAATKVVPGARPSRVGAGLKESGGARHVAALEVRHFGVHPVGLPQHRRCVVALHLPLPRCRPGAKSCMKRDFGRRALDFCLGLVMWGLAAARSPGEAKDFTEAFHEPRRPHGPTQTLVACEELEWSRRKEH